MPFRTQIFCWNTMSNSCCSLRYGKLGCRRYAWRKLSVPYTGVVNPTAFIADRKTKNGKIGIIGTAATISSHSYKLRLEKLNPKYKVYEQACPLFVPLVENGFICRDIRLYGLSSEDIFPNSKKQALTPSFSVALTIRFCVTQLLTLWVTELRLLIRDMKLQSIAQKFSEKTICSTQTVCIRLPNFM